MGRPPSCPLTSGHRRGPEIPGPWPWGLTHLPGVDGCPESQEALPRLLQGHWPWKWATTCGPQGAQGAAPPHAWPSGPSQSSTLDTVTGSLRGMVLPPMHSRTPLLLPQCFWCGRGQDHWLRSLEGRTVRVVKEACCSEPPGTNWGPQADIFNHPRRSLHPGTVPAPGLLPCVRITCRLGLWAGDHRLSLAYPATPREGPPWALKGWGCLLPPSPSTQGGDPWQWSELCPPTSR